VLRLLGVLEIVLVVLVDIVAVVVDDVPGNGVAGRTIDSNVFLLSINRPSGKRNAVDGTTASVGLLPEVAALVVVEGADDVRLAPVVTSSALST
jgi:hypothetical protein